MEKNSCNTEAFHKDINQSICIAEDGHSNRPPLIKIFSKSTLIKSIADSLSASFYYSLF